MCNWDVELIGQLWLLVAVLPAITFAVWGFIIWGLYETYKYVRKERAA